MNGVFEQNQEANDSIIIKIEEIKEKKIFNFTDNINNTYYFGFEIDVEKSSFNPLLIILIVIICILFILLILCLIYICKKKNKADTRKENSFLIVNN